MNEFEELQQRAREIGNQILNLIKEGKTILIVGHLDADGITSASLIGKAIQRRKGRCIIRIYGELTLDVIEELKQGEYDFHILCELGAGLANEIEQALTDRWITLDHHQIPPHETKMTQVFNAWQFGFDGGREISAAGMAYFIAKEIDKDNADLSWLPVIAMVADRQDQGNRRSVFGLNRKILHDAINQGLVKVMNDLLLYGRETKPVHEALASTTTPFIPGLSGNRDACLATLASGGIQLKKNGRWRTLADFNEDEKKKVVESIVPYLTQVETASEAVDSLIGEVYTLTKEDEHSSMRDAREFGTLLNACGRMKQSSIGVSLCLGDRSQALQEGERVLLEYRRSLNRLIQILLEDEARIVEKPGFNMIVGDGVVDEDMLGSLTSIISGIARFETKVLLSRTTTSGYYKLSLRRPPRSDSNINLGLLIHELCKVRGGSGGGHEAAAGGKIPTAQLKVFLRDLNRRLLKDNESKD
jgi:single-stranded-DNA-specific exonuclease